MVISVDLDHIWDPSVLNDTYVKSVIDMIEAKFFDCRESWLIYMLNEDRMDQDDEDDSVLSEAYGNATKTDLAYYFAPMMCHVYNLFLGVFLQTKYPNRRWRMAYFSDHYVVIDLDQTDVIYDLLSHLYNKAGLECNISDWKIETATLKTIDEQLEMIRNDEYY